MTRRANAALRCRRCRVHKSLCVCALIPNPKLVTKTRLVLFIHRYEDRKPTNTGRLATECLANSAIEVRGHLTEPSDPFLWNADVSQPILLFPHEGATPLSDIRVAAGKNVTLIVPDGTWRQASKVRNRVPGIRNIPCASLPPDRPSLYRLRSEAHETGLATIEAIARAMGILEGPEIRRALERVFLAMVERTLWSRGEMQTEEVADGIPEGAERHDPRSGLARQATN